MRLRLTTIALAGLTMFAISPGSRAAPLPDSFEKAIRVLLALQDKAARGHRPAIELQKSLLAQIAESQVSDAQAIQSTPANSSAVLAYVLSGGSPDVAERYAAQEELRENTRIVLTGAAAFMRGDRETARTALAATEPETLPAQDGGRLALVKAMLLADSDPRKMKYLRYAMAAMPGSLIEEAAIRRAIMTTAADGNGNLFLSFADRYLRRFQQSVYAPEFISSVLAGILQLHKNKRLDDLQKMDAVFNRLPQQRRLAAYLHLARSALKNNAPALVQFAARRAGRIARAGSAEEAVARLYAAIYEIAGSDAHVAVATLSNVNDALIGPADILLLQTARQISAEIAKPPEIMTIPPRDGHGENSPGQLERSSREAIEAADTLLHGPEPE